MFTNIITGSMQDSSKSFTVCLKMMKIIVPKLVVGISISAWLRYEEFPVCVHRRCARRRRMLEDRVSGNKKKMNNVVKAVIPVRSHKLAVQVFQRSLYVS